MAPSSMDPSHQSGLPVTEHICSSCKSEITDSAFVRVGAYKFHRDHFRCVVCSTSLSGGKFHQKDGLFYCAADFAAKFCHSCRSCGEKISGGKLVSAFGHYYHPHCFCCRECGVQFDHGKYYERENHPYCEAHFPAPVACAGCSKPVKSEDSVKANGLIYHNTCIVCSHCGKDPSITGAIYQKEGAMYCKEDYMDLFSHRCTQCADHTVKQCISVNEEYYHPPCLFCDAPGCGKMLDKYICVNGHLRCSDHAENASDPFDCSACGVAIDDDTIRCVGMKLHPKCFVCAKCGEPGQKKSMTLRDKKLCCMKCLLKESKHLGKAVTDKSSSSSSSSESASSSSSQSRQPARPPSNHLRVDTVKRRTQSGGQEQFNSAQSNDDDTPQSSRDEVKTPNSGRPNRREPPKRPKIDWKKGELIGKGSFGKVYMGMNIGTGELIAVKQVRLNTTEELEQATAIQNEIGLMENLRHPNVVAFLDTQRQGNKLNILMEFVPGKSLDFLLDKFGALYETVIRSYTKQLLQALDYCHRNGVVHRDIKGKNLLIDTKGNLKLADFGSAKKFVDVMSKDAPSLSYNYTPLWTAPEVLVGDYNSKVDIWSLGCVIIEMASAKPPWSEQNFENPFRALYHIGNSDAIPAIPTTLSEIGQEFVRLCLTRDPDRRPTAAQMLKHPWIETLDVNSAQDHSDSEDDYDDQ